MFCNIKSCDRTANINLPSVKHCCSENFCSFAPGSHATIFLDLPAVFVFTSSLSSLTSLPHRRLHLRCRLRLIAVFIYAVAFASSPSSSTLSPSPHRRLHQRCRLRIIAVFIYAVAFASSQSSSHCHLRSMYPKNPWPSNAEKRTEKSASQQTAYGDGERSPWNVALVLF
ncbi:uncharacterized protein LOC116915560 [Daphnia magna]|uniref:uncharacterized protein LOC116915560 n=1 Tax=Daphnia magna TaxID=35525 RepID=UPI001E1BC8AC|nr:uncharacterized protein LOC116915560 [Daphnia magna]XP_045025307.1 uncharacterized protein LOC116915560 [Daphnia magna]XP_045025308.1 uncharacterized protein LOC116915560 [Daphnia magna]XP_045025309.1 uncharacterized protein LOC116915560 [Daphnia magna]